MPYGHAQRLIDAVLDLDGLRHGDSDSVSYQSAPGVQRFRSLGTGRNAATDKAVSVPVVELSFFLSGDAAQAREVLRAIHECHPYEEPVVYIKPCQRNLHRRGFGEDNPNRFWNRPAEDWVPHDLAG